MVEGTGRYGVTRYSDGLGSWYAVIDRKARAASNIVKACRSRNEAHAEADRLNSGRFVSGAERALRS